MFVPLSAQELLQAWERGGAQAPPGQVLELLKAALPGFGAGKLARLPIGRRDVLLMMLKEQLFGPRVDGLARCPSCGERAELGFNVNDVRGAMAPPPGEPFVIERNDYQVRFRLVDSLDLASLSPRMADGARWLFERCTLGVLKDGVEVAAAMLPEEVMLAVAEEMERLDSQARVEFVTACPVCQHGWRVSFDIGEFLWAEVSAWARRLLREVDAIARVYGWSEAEIIAMSPGKRRLYLEMCTG